MIIIIGCGKRKSEHPQPAFKLYTGTQFQLTWRWATSIVAARDVRIFSAKYGLVEPMTVLHPYDLKMSRHGGVTADVLREQLKAIANEELIGVIGGEYRRILAEAGAVVRYPFRETLPDSRIGYLRQALTANMGKIPA